ncbi:LppX_LprAFG lipoprotein [Mycobacterium sp. 852002-51163_SCH5372311]|uniref:LppX_LprAFG lipoprotein n=1 Tax=Mycobacterium sp. 852002-51163_SCH5372311 TaxID=1834097 RepID=UPI0009ED4301
MQPPPAAVEPDAVARPSRTRLLLGLGVLLIVGVVVAAAVVIFFLQHDSKKSGAPLPDAKTLVKQSADVTKTVKTAHLDLTVNGKIQGLPLKALTGDLATTPTTAAKGNAKILLGGSSEIDADFVILDGELYSTALSPGKWDDMGKVDDLVHYDPSSILNPDTGLANVLANLTDPKAEGRDTINGQTTIRISGKVSADVLNKLAPLNVSQPTPTTVWIQETGDHQLAQVKVDKGSGNSIQMALSNWNQPVQVTKPES